MNKDVRSKVVGKKQYRSLTVKNKESIDIENRTVELAFASETPYERWWGEEIIDTSRMDLERLNSGGALLWNHDNKDGHIGVVERAWVDDDKIARAVVRFSKKQFADDIFNDVVDGIIKQVSFGYEITDFNMIKEAENKGELNVYKVATNSYEVSMVHTAADIGVGVGRSITPEQIVNDSAVNESEDKQTLEVSEMENTERTVEETVVETPVVETVESIDTEALEKAAFEKGVETRKAYVTEVKELCKLAGFDELVDGFINENVEVKTIREILAEKKAETENEEIATVRVEAGNEDLVLKRKEERTKQLAHLMDPSNNEASEAFKSIRTSHAMIKSIMAENNADVTMIDAEGITNAVLNRDHSTSDFPIILKDAANKTLQASFDAARAVQTFRPLVREISVADYKEINYARLGESPDLLKMVEGQEYPSSTVGEAGGSYKVEDYGRMISFTDRALRNDDLGAFSQGLLQFASSAASLESKLFWEEFTASANYSVPQNNLHATTALDLAGIAKLETALMTQKGLESDDPLNLMAAYLVVPPSKKVDAMQLMSSAYVPNTQGEINPYAGSMQVIVDARLADGEWYMTAAPSQIELIQGAFLNGRRAPMLDQRINFTTDSLDAKIKHTLAYKATDYRGLQKATDA